MCSAVLYFSEGEIKLLCRFASADARGPSASSTDSLIERTADDLDSGVFCANLSSSLFRYPSVIGNQASASASRPSPLLLLLPGTTSWLDTATATATATATWPDLAHTAKYSTVQYRNVTDGGLLYKPHRSWLPSPPAETNHTRRGCQSLTDHHRSRSSQPHRPHQSASRPRPTTRSPSPPPAPASTLHKPGSGPSPPAQN